MRASALGYDASRRFRVRLESDVTALAPRISCPTLVVNADRDTNPPLAEGRLAASLVPGAQFVTLRSRNHVLLANEPAWRRWCEEVDGFLRRPSTSDSALEGLSARELEVAALVAEGLDNAQVAARLDLSEKTVRNHLTRILAKTGTGTRARLIVLANKLGLRSRVC